MITTHLPPVMGGIEVHCDNLARALVGQGHSVTLYGSLEPDQPSSMSHSIVDEDLRVRRVPARFLPGLRRPTRFVNLRRLLLADHETRRFDLIHAHQLFPVGIAAAHCARTVNAGLVITEHGSILDDAKSIWKRPLIRWAASRACSIITASRELSEEVVGAGIPRENVRSIANAVPLDRFRDLGSPEACRRDLGFQVDDFLVMTVRRLVPKTGVQYAIRALPRCVEELPNLRLVVVGDGPLRSELEQQASAEGVADRVTFVGTIDNAHVPRLMRAADVGLFPSLAEATSIAALEFMGAGTPVIASRVGGLPEIVEDGTTGFLFDIGLTRSQYADPTLPEHAVDNLANAIIRAAHSDLASIGEAAARHVWEQHSWKRYAEVLEREVYPVAP